MISPTFRAGLGLTCGAILALAGSTHVVVQLTGMRASRLELLLVYTALVVCAGLLGARRARGWKRGLYAGGAALALGSALALVAVPNPTVQALGRGAVLATLLGYALPWAARPLRGSLDNWLAAVQFGVGLFVADQLAAFGIGDLVLSAWPELELRSWPLAVVGRLVQESCLLLVVGAYGLAAPGRIDWRGLRLPEPHARAWLPVVVAALQAEYGLIVLQALLALALQVLHIDVAGIGNATVPAPGDWQPDLPVSVVLLAVLPGMLEELVFRGVLFGRLRAYVPLGVAVVLSTGLFGLAHLSPDMDLPNLVAVFLDTFVFGSLAALAYVRTGSLYAAILGHVLSNTGPALAVVLPQELMGWVFLVTAELATLGLLPFVFAVVRRQRQRWAMSPTHRS